jgi:hypothetical protein
MSVYCGIIMTAELRGIEILRREDVSPEEFKKIHEQLTTTQLPIKARRGKATYHIGEIRKVAEGRDGLMVDLAFSTSFKLRMKGAGNDIVAEYLEWKI